MTRQTHLLRTSQIETVYPAPGASAIVAAPGAGVWGNWSEVLAATPSDFVLHGAHVAYAAQAVAAGHLAPAAQIQIGMGAEDSEEVIAQGAFALYFYLGSETTVYGIHVVTHLFKPRLILAGVRIAARAVNISDVPATGVYVTGYLASEWAPSRDYYREQPVIEGQGTVGYRSRVYPDASRTTVPGAGAGFTWGAWTEFIAATPYPTILRGLHTNPEIAVRSTGHFQIGIGPAESEDPVILLGHPLAGNFPAGGTLLAPRPYWVPAGVRVSVRVNSRYANHDFPTQLLVDELD